MNALAVSPERASLRIKRRQSTEHKVIKKRSHEIDSIRRATGNINSGNAKSLADTRGISRVRMGGNNVAINGTCSNGDSRCSLGSDFLADFKTSLPLWTKPHVLSIKAAGDRSLDDADKFTGEIFKSLLKTFFSLVPSSGHDCLMIFERNSFQEDACHIRMR
ncbi:MAG: hypothetical protein A4E66_02368 [Syntrophus sp. PtaB.Bin001]|nr:MAG: hypothetical protein A4E66_02368 [Syntrophus sp. PtaB.Bin001]